MEGCASCDRKSVWEDSTVKDSFSTQDKSNADPLIEEKLGTCSQVSELLPLKIGFVIVTLTDRKSAGRWIVVGREFSQLAYSWLWKLCKAFAALFDIAHPSFLFAPTFFIMMVASFLGDARCPASLLYCSGQRLPVQGLTQSVTVCLTHSREDFLFVCLWTWASILE